MSGSQSRMIVVAKVSLISLQTFEAVISSEGHFFSQNDNYIAHLLPKSLGN